MVDVRAVRMTDCNLTDAAASLLVDSVLGSSATRTLDFKGIEMGANFINSLESALENDPYCLEELGLEGVRAAVSMSYLIRALQPCKNLTYLDLTYNPMHETVAEDVASLVRDTPSLEYLNLSSCQLRGRASEVILDGLMANESVKYLILNTNSFASRDHLLAAKLGRMLQGHPGLLHVNLAHCQLARAEVLYFALCIRDSRNIQGIHLTGNRYSHYDRRLMRALFPAKVRWPQSGPSVPRFEKISARDKVILVMLNRCFLGSIPPPYVPEVGMSAVHTVDEVKSRLRSHGTRSRMKEELEAAEAGLDEVKRAHVGRAKELLVPEGLADVQPASQSGDAQKVGNSGALSTMVRRAGGAAKNRLVTEDSLAEPSTPRQDAEKYNLQRLLNDPDARAYDLFGMLDFYGRKKRCIEMGKPLTNQDKQWYRDQKHRLQQRKHPTGKPGASRVAGRSPGTKSALSPTKRGKLQPGSTLAGRG